MASPLSWFRQHQKGMLVVFGILLMASFGLASVMNSLTPTGSRNEFAMKPVVKYSGGTFTNSDFALMRNRHFQAVNFLERFQQMLQTSRPDFQPRPIMINKMNSDAAPDEMNGLIMERFLASKKAESIGIEVSDQAVLQYLRNFASDQSLTHYDFDRICLEIAGDQVDFIDIREQLKTELAIQQVNQMYASGVPGVPSITEAWEAFQKLENRIECQIVGFPVDNFMAQVTETPTDSELRNLYEEGKYEFPDIAGERPGFKQRRKLAVAMLSANYQEFLDRAKLAITPEQIKAEYDLLVSANSPVVTEIVPQPTEAGGDNASGDDPPPTLDGDETPSTPTDDGAAPATDLDSDGKAEAGDGSSPLTRLTSLNVQFVSTTAASRFQQEGTGTQDPTIPVQPPVDPLAIPKLDPLAVPDQQVETQIKPLNEALSDVIRGRLAAGPAVDEMTVALSEASSEVAEYGVDYEEWSQSKNLPAEDRTIEPAPIDPKTVANKYHLQYKLQPLSDELDMSNSIVGKTIVAVEINTFYGPQTRDVQIAALLFNKFHELGTWQPEIFEEYFVPNQHLVFATEKSTPTVPEFANANADVEKFWKREKALVLAKAAANKVADQLNSSGQLVSVVDPAGVKNTGGFTWHTQSSLYPVFPGNIRPGEEFMETAFALENNKAGVAPDLLRETVYVIQKVHLDSRTNEELQELFFQSMATNKGFGSSIGQLHQQQIRQLSSEFFDQLNEEYQVKWLGD